MLDDHIDPGSPVPLYDQIATRIRVAVATGELQSGQTLPSVRDLAGRLRVNPATVVQAYRELEKEGFVEMRQGTGTFVRAVESDRRRRARSDRARRLVRTMIGEAGRLGLSMEEIMDAFQEEVGEEAK